MWARLRKWANEFSWQHRVFLVVQIAIAVWTFNLWFHLPMPGWAVAIMAGVAAAMSVHGDMRPWQKAAWMVLIGVLLVIELRAISKDRSDSENKAYSDRQAQDSAFQNVRTTQDEDFKATAGGLKTAIDGIKSTLLAANRTLLQTQPHATMRLDAFEFYPNPPSQIEANTDYQINYHYINSGTATAINAKTMAELYVANADDKDAQLKLAQKFDEEWRTADIKASPSIVPGTPLFGTLHRTFAKDEMIDINPNKTVYFLVRFEYSDETGRWRTDSCEAYQRNSPTEVNTSVAHICLTFEKTRYPLFR